MAITKDTLSFLVTIKDRVNASGGDSEHDNLVQVPIKVIVLDENDVVPEFQNVPYEAEVSESAPPGTRIFNSILVTDEDTVGENLNITCLTVPQKILIKSSQSAISLPSNAATESYEPCSKFAIELIESNQDRLKAAIILKEKLDYNEQMIYHLLLTATIDYNSSVFFIPFRILGSDNIQDLFTIDKHTGQLFIKDTAALDVNHLKSENIFFSVEADDGAFVAVCNVNITIRDVNNHAPKFVRNNYMTTIAENTAIGTIVERVHATDLDTGINAKVRYRIQHGSFDDFSIDNTTGFISIARKLDYDKRENYRIEVVASDLGIPSLSGTATVSINLINSNDKAPFFIPATQRAEVREDAPIGKRIYQLVAHDPDVTSYDVLIYEVTEPITAVNKNGKEVNDSQAFKHLFAVDQYGNVTVNGLLDRDFFAVVRLTVVVTDPTAPTLQQSKGLLVITIIEVNEMPPVFALPWTPATPKLIYQFMEEQAIGTKLTQLQATDSDSNIEAYHLSSNDYFEINNITGIITTKARIDYESIKQIYMNAYVTDTGIPQMTSTAEIIVEIVNMNDNEPVFSLPEYQKSKFTSHLVTSKQNGIYRYRCQIRR